MPLEDLIGEIRRQGEADLAKIADERGSKADAISADRSRRLDAVRTESSRLSEAEISQMRAQELAAAKLKARKMVYEAREARLTKAVADTRTLLVDYTQSEEYPQVLKRMFAEATNALGKQVRVTGREEDAAALQKVAGRAFDPRPQPILGGLIAETPDGSRRLNLSFDELLRLNEDRVRELLA